MFVYTNKHVYVYMHIYIYIYCIPRWYVMIQCVFRHCEFNQCLKVGMGVSCVVAGTCGGLKDQFVRPLGSNTFTAALIRSGRNISSWGSQVSQNHGWRLLQNALWKFKSPRGWSHLSRERERELDIIYKSISQNKPLCIIPLHKQKPPDGSNFWKLAVGPGDHSAVVALIILLRILNLYYYYYYYYYHYYLYE